MLAGRAGNAWRRTTYAVVCGSLVLVAAGCGSSSSGSGGGSGSGGSGSGSGGTVILGSTDTIVSGDPAAAYDLPSWTWIYNVYQTPLAVPPGTSSIAPEAASCAFHGKLHYICTMKPGQKFSNGDQVTGQDLVYSIKRVIKIQSATGPSSLFASVKNVSASGPKVTFTLKAPNATFPYILTTAAAAIVDPKVFSATKVLKDDSKIIGSGPYQLSSYTPNQLAEFTPNPNYGGDDQLANSKFIVKYEQNASTLVSDAQQGNVDIAYRTLNPTELQTLKNSSGIQQVVGVGIEIRYMVFNEKLMPGSSAQQLAVRQAAAQIIDRASIASNVYRGTVTPLYSVVPQGLHGATTALKSRYGAGPNVAKAKSTLQSAGVNAPVPITLWYNINHYNDQDLATEVQRQLEASGLFKVKLQSSDWATYNEAALKNQYQTFLFGWFPDYPDADDYTGPFFPCKTEFLNDHYCNPKVDRLIAAEEASTSQGARQRAFTAMQTQLANDVPLIPIWQGGQVADARDGVTNVKETLDPAYTFRFWLIGKSS